MNSVTLIGTIEPNAKGGLYIRDDDYFRFDLSVPRKSDVVDHIPIMAHTYKLNRMSFVEMQGKEIVVYGRLISLKTVLGGKVRKVVHVLADEIRFLTDEDKFESNNVVELSGIISDLPIYKVTKSKRSIAEMGLMNSISPDGVKQSYIEENLDSRGPGEYTSVLPIICWGKNALRAKKFCYGDIITGVGRLQERKYTKNLDNGETVKRFTYEVSMSKIDKTGHSDI